MLHVHNIALTLFWTDGSQMTNICYRKIGFKVLHTLHLIPCQADLFIKAEQVALTFYCHLTQTPVDNQKAAITAACTLLPHFRSCWQLCCDAESPSVVAEKSLVFHTAVLHGFFLFWWLRKEIHTKIQGADASVFGWPCIFHIAEMNRHHYSLYVHNCRLVFLLRRDFTQVDTIRPAEFHWKLEQVRSVFAWACLCPIWVCRFRVILYSRWRAIIICVVKRETLHSNYRRPSITFCSSLKEIKG